MNVVEAYYKFKGQLVLVVSGMSGCGKSKIAKMIATAFGLKFVDQFKFYKKDFTNMVNGPENIQVQDFNTDDAIDWEKFNEEVVGTESGPGVVISAFSLPKTHINFTIDYHIHLSMTKQKCIEKREAYYTKKPQKAPKIDIKLEKWIFNHLTYPYYLNTKKLMSIDKIINITDMNEEEIYDIVWDEFINFINNYTQEFTRMNNGELYKKWKEQNTTVNE